MLLKGDIITKDDVQDCYFSSFEDKYIIFDNLDRKNDPNIRAREEIYNSEYVFVTVVLRGALHLIIGGVEITVKSNEMIAVMPCMTIEVKDSKCLFFSYLVKGYIAFGIYDRTKIGIEKAYIHAFHLSHVHFTPEKTQTFLNIYKHFRTEHLRPDFPMKEIVLRSYHTALLSKMASLINAEDDIAHVKNTRQYKFFRDFMIKLRDGHMKERSVQYYANAMNITPKYLSAIVLNFTGITASQVIDQYVAFAIKQKLYTNQNNIKSISKEFNFPSQSFFGRYFKRITGFSPNEYIKRHNIKSINFEKSDK